MPDCISGGGRGGGASRSRISSSVMKTGTTARARHDVYVKSALAGRETTEQAAHDDDWGKLSGPALRESEDGKIPPNVDDCGAACVSARHSVGRYGCFCERRRNRLGRNAAAATTGDHGPIQRTRAARFRPLALYGRWTNRARSHNAAAFGDAVGTKGRAPPSCWERSPRSPARRSWYTPTDRNAAGTSRRMPAATGRR